MVFFEYDAEAERELFTGMAYRKAELNRLFNYAKPLVCQRKISSKIRK